MRVIIKSLAAGMELELTGGDDALDGATTAGFDLGESAQNQPIASGRDCLIQ